MKKLLATLTTVAMLATTTAFAAPVANDAGYDAEAGTYSVAANLSEVSGQLTLLIIPEAAYLAGEIEDADILYIDQGAYADGLFQSVGILGGTELEAGTYYAKIGGTGLDEIIVETFTIVEESQGVKFIWGNVNNSGDGVEITDATAIVDYTLGKANTYGDYTVGAAVGNVIWGNVNNSGDGVEITDATAIVDYTLGKANTYGDYTVGTEATVSVN